MLLTLRCKILPPMLNPLKEHSADHIIFRKSQQAALALAGSANDDAENLLLIQAGFP